MFVDDELGVTGSSMGLHKSVGHEEDELDEMNRLVTLELSRQEYEPDHDDSVVSGDTSASLLTNSSYNLVESNWHCASQNLYKEIQYQLKQQLKETKAQVLKEQNEKRNKTKKMQLESMANPPLVLSSSIITIPHGSKFFVIKSFNQQDINSSFIHKIWSSTDLGNKRLSKAFKSAMSTERIFLLFSVNGSGKFCGVAEMKSDLATKEDETHKVWMDSGRWKGSFQIQWLIIKDISNNHFKNLKFYSRNNYTNTYELKPVTNSRDTQELSFQVGKNMIEIFKTTTSSTSFLQGIVHT